ncbi:magnesium transporter [Ornithinibacter aureus]|uniref:Magnesium transporter n=1 Tax=Ornithinibacter aureus TaxID=622664 RepID=A0ABP8JA92_9MICO|nr:magnesium transporter [Ornithinibacter aureus]KAF0832812.1 Mg/Co/Ni transporter MgtE [Ornithinibacter aureus]
MARDDLSALSTVVSGLSTRAVIDLVERLSTRQRAVVYRLLPKQQALDVFEALQPSLQGELVQGVQDSEVVALFADLDPDDRMWLIDELPATVAQRLLQGLPDDERRLTAAILGYPHESIGRRMSPEYVVTHPQDSVGPTLAAVRQRVADAETVYTLPVVDEERRVIGVVSLRDLLGGADDDVVGSLMAPEREDSEDLARQGGVEPLQRPYLSTPITSIVRSRVVWLFVLAVGASLTVQVLSVFEDTLEEVTVLALFVPLLIGTGGNTGNQAATTVTRALALGDVRPADLLAVLLRELRVGVLLGVLLGALGFALTSVFYDVQVATVIGLTLVAVCTLAATNGGVMPLAARAIKVDPAVFSNPFITTFVDASGLIIYLLIARAVLGL